jgi:hypothetical protein
MMASNANVIGPPRGVLLAEFVAPLIDNRTVQPPFETQGIQDAQGTETTVDNDKTRPQTNEL